MLIIKEYVFFLSLDASFYFENIWTKFFQDKSLISEFDTIDY